MLAEIEKAPLRKTVSALQLATGSAVASGDSSTLDSDSIKLFRERPLGDGGNESKSITSNTNSLREIGVFHGDLLFWTFSRDSSSLNKPDTATSLGNGDSMHDFRVYSYNFGSCEIEVEHRSRGSFSYDTGLSLWTSALVMCQYLTNEKGAALIETIARENGTIIELGSGAGRAFLGICLV